MTEEQTSPFLEFEPFYVCYSILLSLLGGWVWPGPMNPVHVLSGKRPGDPNLGFIAFPRSLTEMCVSCLQAFQQAA